MTLKRRRAHQLLRGPAAVVFVVLVVVVVVSVCSGSGGALGDLFEAPKESGEKARSVHLE